MSAEVDAIISATEEARVAAVALVSQAFPDAVGVEPMIGSVFGLPSGATCVVIPVYVLDRYEPPEPRVVRL